MEGDYTKHDRSMMYVSATAEQLADRVEMLVTADDPSFSSWLEEFFAERERSDDVVKIQREAGGFRVQFGDSVSADECRILANEVMRSFASEVRDVQEKH